MKILVINCGSSSIKYKLYDFPAGILLIRGAIERIGELGSAVRNHTQGVGALIAEIINKRVISGLDEILAIGHRVVHGGETFWQPQVIDSKVIKKIEECSQLAPLHNPANLAGITSCRKLIPDTLQVAVFDTAFHQSIPKTAYLYAIPNVYYKKYKIRKYGFHGTSHQYVALEASKVLKRPLSKLKLITCHLGNGCSITAIDKGKSIDTSMGFTPLEGLMMGTRSGDIDVAAVFHIMKRQKLSIADMGKILNKKSGFLGVSGLSNDFRVIDRAIKKGNRLAKIAYEMFLYRIKKYIGAYHFILGGTDAICLTGGIGQNSIRLLNSLKKAILKLSSRRIKVLVIPTDEELMIANLTYKIVGTKNKTKRRKR